MPHTMPQQGIFLPSPWSTVCCLQQQQPIPQVPASNSEQQLQMHSIIRSSSSHHQSPESPQHFSHSQATHCQQSGNFNILIKSNLKSSENVLKAKNIFKRSGWRCGVFKSCPSQWHTYAFFCKTFQQCCLCQG